MQAAIGGDASSYRRLLESLAPLLRSLARRGFERAGMGNAEIEDVVQETLLAIHLKRDTWDRTKSAGPWIMAISRYKLIDALRRRGRSAGVQVDDLAESLADESARDGADEQDVERVLEGLNGRALDIVRSVSLEGQGVRETAERLQMTEVAVRVSLHRSLKQLARQYRQARE